MKRLLPVLLALALLLTGCQNAGQNEPDLKPQEPAGDAQTENTASPAPVEDAVKIVLSDEEITVDGEAISGDTGEVVYAANDIVFYLEGQDFTYGEGTETDAHCQSEADAHTVVHITQPGTYALSGKLSAGQIAVDLGAEAEEDPEAAVTLILDGVDITCTVAPAVIFYNVYECGSKDTETASETVDTTAAGANVIIADGTENYVNGSYVARIYKPDTVELNAAGTEVADAKKLHKYDAAFYSKMSMNMDGGEVGSGVLRIDAENEGLDSELHLTINGGNIYIESGNDGINTNEDGVSVTTINGGWLGITVTGETGEGDGIDSNGWLVINGGTVIAQACSTSGDAGIDSDMGIYLNGGNVVAYGNMLDRIAGGDVIYAVFQFADRQTGNVENKTSYALKNDDGFEYSVLPTNDFTYWLISNEDLTPGEYTLWRGDVQLAGVSGTAMGQMGNMPPPGGFDQQPAMPDGPTMPEGSKPPEEMEQQFQLNEDGTVTLPDGTIVDPSQMPQPGEGQMAPPGGVTMPEGQNPPVGQTMPQSQTAPAEGGDRPGGNHFRGQMGEMELSTAFTIVPGGNYFTNVAPAS